MKKILMLLALVGMMVSCNENKPGNKDAGQDPIEIKVENITSVSAELSFIPHDKELGYMYGCISKDMYVMFIAALKTNLKEQLIAEGKTYEELISEGELYRGDILREFWPALAPNTEHVVWACHVSEDFDIVGEVCTFEFTTLEEEP